MANWYCTEIKYFTAREIRIKPVNTAAILSCNLKTSQGLIIQLLTKTYTYVKFVFNIDM